MNVTHTKHPLLQQLLEDTHEIDNEIKALLDKIEFLQVKRADHEKAFGDFPLSERQDHYFTENKWVGSNVGPTCRIGAWYYRMPLSMAYKKAI